MVYSRLTENERVMKPLSTIRAGRQRCSPAAAPVAGAPDDVAAALLRRLAADRESNVKVKSVPQAGVRVGNEVVEAFFTWCHTQRQRMDLVNSTPLAKALVYADNHQAQLRVYLGDPDVPIDTNHLERALRVIPMGRKNWLFCWSEVGAKHVGIIQSLLTTCRLHGVDPYTYLVDVLQRISVHPASRVAELTPREWKTRFSQTPMRSDLALAEQ